jgi:hypothetical protein
VGSDLYIAMLSDQSAIGPFEFGNWMIFIGLPVVVLIYIAARR